MDSTVTIGDRVRQARMDRGWSQFELGERIGMSQRTISRIETNKYTTSLRSDILMRLAEVLGVPYDDLALATGIVTTRQAAHALREYHRRSKRERDRLDEIHGQLDPLLLELDQRQTERVIEYVKDRVDMMREAAAIRQAADPGQPGTSPQSPPAGSTEDTPPRPAPESAGSGCGR